MYFSRDRRIGLTRPGARGLLVSAVLLTIGLYPAVAGAQSSNFNDGTDTGWTHYDPLAAIPGGSPSQYTFPNGAYRIQAAPSPDPSNFGPARAGSLRNDKTYTQFAVEVDLTAFDDSHNQALGLLARMTNVGLGTSDGYAFTYSPVGDSIDLSRIDSEQPTGLATAPLTLDPTHAYRLVLTGNGPDLNAQIFDDADLTTPLASLAASDSTYDHGVNGLVVFDNESGNLGADGTFDNYFAAVTLPEPAAISLLGFAAVGFIRCRRPAATASPIRQ